MRGVQPALAGLRPVALLQFLGDEAAPRRHQAELKGRHWRWLVRRAHVSPYEVAILFCRIGLELNLLAHGRAAWYRGHVQTVAV